MTDIRLYTFAQYRLFQLRSIEQASRLIGIVLIYYIVVSLVLIGTIFLAIALAAWLEQWLPMWASYLVIAGLVFMLIWLLVISRKIWLIHPIEKRLTAGVTGSHKELEVQRQSAENQKAIQQEFLQRDLIECKQEWAQAERILQLIRNIFS